MASFAILYAYLLHAYIKTRFTLFIFSYWDEQQLYPLYFNKTYGREAWSFTINGEQSTSLFENGMLRRNFRPKTNEVTES
jgi:hypothetical protein